MNFNTTAFIFCLIIAISSISDMSTASAQQGEYRYLFGDKVMLRDAPSRKGKKLQALPVGTRLKILSKTNKTLTLQGIKDHWYEVEAAGRKGYLWGGLIATHAIEGNLDGIRKDEVFLMRYIVDDTIKGYPDKFPVMEIRLARKGKLVTSLNKKISGFIRKVSVRLDVRKDFRPHARLIRVKHEFHGATEGNGEYIFTVYKKKVYPAFSILYYDGEGGFACTRKMIFPVDTGGRYNRLTVKSSCADVSNCTGETGDDPCDYERTTEVYKWNGKYFVK